MRRRDGPCRRPRAGRARPAPQRPAGGAARRAACRGARRALDEAAQQERRRRSAELRAAGVESCSAPRQRCPPLPTCSSRARACPTRAPRAGGAAPRHAALERGRVRLPLPRQPRSSASPAPTARRRPPSWPARILRDAGLPVAVGGNVGHALAGCPARSPPDAVVVAELSSFQLEHIERFRPEVAVLLNLSEDHLDRHGTYRATWTPSCASSRTSAPTTWRCSTPTTRARSRAGGRAPRGRAAAAGSRPCPAAPRPGGEPLSPASRDDALWLRVGAASAAPLCRRGELALKRRPQPAQLAGRRGRRGLRRRRAAGRGAATLRTFAGRAHRLQVGSIVGGVTYVNDSKATNVDATLKALTAYSGGVHLILGGYDKGAEYGELAAATEGRVKQVLLIGATAPQLRRRSPPSCRGGRADATPYVVCGDLEAAVGAPRASPSRATSCCSARPARAGTSTGTSSSGANTSSAGERAARRARELGTRGRARARHADWARTLRARSSRGRAPRRPTRRRRRRAPRRRAPRRRAARRRAAPLLAPLRGSARATDAEQPARRRRAASAAPAPLGPGVAERRALILVTFLLVVYGLVMAYSASAAEAYFQYGSSFYFFSARSSGSCSAWRHGGAVSRRLRLVPPAALPFAGLALAGLVARPRPRRRHPINGARRWIIVGGQCLQPSEFAKLAAVVLVAALIARRPREVATAARLPAARRPSASCPAAALIMLEPDLGTTLVLVAAVVAVLVAAGAPLRLPFALVARRLRSPSWRSSSSSPTAWSA